MVIMKKLKIGYIGLGKMGVNMVLRMRDKGYSVVAFNRSEEPRKEARRKGIIVAESVGELVRGLSGPRTVWLMVSNSGVDQMLAEVLKFVERGDTIIDGGNSFYKDSIRRAETLSKKGIDFLDVGVSGGPKGAREGACIMAGGKKKIYEKYETLFRDLTQNSESKQNKGNKNYSSILQNIGMVSGGYANVGGAGAGHFVKMVHNGIEYGMMQAIAEGFSILRCADSRRLYADLRGQGGDRRGKGKFGLDLKEIARLYNHKSVVESRLIGWLANAYEEYGTDLAGISGSVAHTGEGEWTVKTAKELGIPTPIIEGAFKFRVASAKKPSYIGQVLSALRNQFGGHSFRKN